MTRKYVPSSAFDIANTCTTFACCKNSDRRASSRNIATNRSFVVEVRQHALDRYRLLVALQRFADAAEHLGLTAAPEAFEHRVLGLHSAAIIACSLRRGVV